MDFLRKYRRRDWRGWNKILSSMRVVLGTITYGIAFLCEGFMDRQC